MYSDLDYEKLCPIDIMQVLKGKKDKERIDKILDLGVFKAVDGNLEIQTYKCITHKTIGTDTKQFKSYFPFHHQIFWFSLMEMKDLDFAISELARVLKGERQYAFPNGTMVQLEK